LGFALGNLVLQEAGEFFAFRGSSLLIRSGSLDNNSIAFDLVLERAFLVDLAGFLFGQIAFQGPPGSDSLFFEGGGVLLGFMNSLQ